MRRVLIVANLTLGGPHLWEEVHRRVAEESCAVHVVVPAAHDPMAGAWTEAEARAEAAVRLERALTRFADLGVDADGEVGDIRAIDATLDVLRHAEYDEIIISTLPPNVSRWLRLDLVSRLRRAVDVPVTHVVGEPELVGR